MSTRRIPRIRPAIDIGDGWEVMKTIRESIAVKGQRLPRSWPT